MASLRVRALRAFPFAGLVLAVLALSGCYRSHVRGDPTDAALDVPARDAAVSDAPRRDAPAIDAGPIACDALAVTGMVTLDEGVTPRLVALPGGDVGVVYVRVDGDPTRVVYERLDRSLGRVTGPVTVATDSFTWAELEIVESEVLIAYGLAGSRESVLAHVSFDGVSTGEREVVPLHHPSIFSRSQIGELLWGAFEMERDNSLVLTHVTRTGEVLHPALAIELGRYGSGHHAARRPDGSHVLGYPREGPPGSRHGYVSTISASGVLGPERQLDAADSDQSVTPVMLAGGLVIVRATDEALMIEPTDLDTLERIDRVTFPPLETPPLAATLADRLVVAHVASGVFRWDFFAEDLSGGDRYEVATGHAGIGSGTSVVMQPGALVFALGLTDGSTASPWIVRIECID